MCHCGDVSHSYSWSQWVLSIPMSVQALTEKSASPSDWTALVLIEKEALVGFGLGLALDPYV